MNTHNKILG